MVFERLVLCPGVVAGYLEYLFGLPLPEYRFDVANLNDSVSPRDHPPRVLSQLLDYLHTLRLIEAIDPHQHEFRISSDVARTALSSLSAFAEDSIWTGETLSEIAGHSPQHGWTISDLIRLEHLRVEAAARAGVEARPLREQKSALIIVKAHAPAGDAYLLARRKDWPGYSLIGGKFEAGADRDLEDTARREIEEELRLNKEDFSLEALPLAPVHLRTISERVGVLTDYTFEFFQLFAAGLQVGKPHYEWFRVRAIRPEAGLSVEDFGHLAYPEVQQALWRQLSGGLDALRPSLVMLKLP